MAKCYNCGCTLPAGTAVKTRVLKGHNGRKKDGYVLMCAACSKATNDQNAVVLGLALVGMVVVTIIWVLFQVLQK